MNRRSKGMRFIAGMIVFILTFMNCYVGDTAYAKSNNKKEEIKAEKQVRGKDKTDIIVKYKNSSEVSNTINRVKTKSKAGKLNQKHYFKKQRIGFYETDASDDIHAVINELNKDPNVEYAQPNYPLNIASIPTDDSMDQQWLIYNDGQEVNGYRGRATVDINALNAWNLTMGDSDTVIGILDTGIDTGHKELKNNIFTNTSEIPGNGKDDDENGYIDDIHGWDFANDDATVYDSATVDAHGTYIAGIIAAEADNGGIVGVAPKGKVLPLKFISGSTGYTSDAIEAIEYAMYMGVKIINCSFGGTDHNQALKDAMANSEMLFICSAGNRGGNTAEKPVYPAAFDLDNVISVTSVDSRGLIPDYASYGGNVDIAAPGTSIISTKPENGYSYFSGTSVSSAVVSGIAALLQSYFPKKDMSSIKERILNTVTVSAALDGKTATGGRVDAYGALTNTIQEMDYYSGESDVEDLLPIDGTGEADTWYIMNELASNVERFHYGEGGINPVSGNYSVTCTDMEVSAPGFQINISRTYNSRNMKQTLLGRGWTFGFEGRITDRTNAVEISLTNGSSYVFNLQDGKYVGEGTRALFERNKDGADLLTTTDQYKYGFDTVSHKLIYMEDKNGNRINLIYSEEKLARITDTVGRIYELTYNDTGLLENVTDPSGRKVTYTYTKNLLTKVTDPTGNSLCYEYDTSEYLTGLIDQNGNTFQRLKYSHDYGDAENKVIKSVDGAGETWSYSYDPANSNTTITNNQGKKWTYWFDIYMGIVKMQDPEGRYTFTEYDYHDVNKYYGDVIARVDRSGNRTEYEIDHTTGNTTKIINPDGGFCSYVYDQWNNVIEEVNERNQRTYYIYDAKGQNLLKKAQPLDGVADYAEGNNTNFAITAYTYYAKEKANSGFGCNVAGLLKTVTDPEGNTTTYTYNQYGDITAITDAAGNVTACTYNTIGQKLSETTAEGNKTQWIYNRNGQVIKEIHPDTGAKRTVYDPAGHVVLEVKPEDYEAIKEDKKTGTYTGTVGIAYEWYDSGYLRAVTDEAGSRTEYTWDVFGNKQTEKKPDGALNRYEYDVLNRLTKTWFREKSTSGELLLNEISYSILSNGNTQTTTKVYADNERTTTMVTVKDYAGREVLVQYGDYSRTMTEYHKDGTVKQKTAANGAITYYEYDPMGNRINEWKPMSVEEGNTLYSWTGYTYDKAGSLTEIKAGKPLVALKATTEEVFRKRYAYEDGLLKQETDSEGRRTAYSYDKEGNVSQTVQDISPTEQQVTEQQYNYRKQVTSSMSKVRAGDTSGHEFADNDIIDITYTYTYDYDGNLTASEDPAGNRTTYAYDQLDRLLSTTRPLKDSMGNLVAEAVTSHTYTWDGKIASQTDARGNTTRYYYDARGNQIKMVDALGNTTLKYYDRLGRKIAIVSPKNYIPGAQLGEMERTVFVYDSMGRIAKQLEVYRKAGLNSIYELTWGWAEVTAKTYQYDTLGNVITTKDALGNVTSTDYNLAGLQERMTDAETSARGLPFTVRYTYNGLDQRIKEEYPGVVYTYRYNGAGSLLETRVNGVTKSSAVYDYLGRLICDTDGYGHTATQRWNALGKVSRTATPGDETIASNSTIYQYDLLGNLMYSKDSIGAVTAYTYDSLGRNLSKTVSDASSGDRITVSNTYDLNNNVLSRTDGNGNTTYSTYDELNRQKTTTNAKYQKTEFTYDANGNLTEQKDYLGNRTMKVYDGINRLVEIRDTYGNIVQQLLYNDADAQISSFDALHNETRYLYDKNLRQTGIIDALGCQSSMAYDTRGNVISETDGNGNTTSFEYDTEKRLTRVADALGNSTYYTYDLNGNMLIQTDGNGNTTSYRYNAASLPKTKTDAAGRKETYSYYANGLKASRTDRNGIVTTYTYDVFGRLIKEDAGGELQIYTYDDNGNLLTMTDSTGTTARTYDELNYNISKTVPNIGRSSYEYDLPSEEEGCYGERTTDPKGNVTEKTYDRMGRLVAVTVGEETTTYEYYRNGRKFRVTYPDGTMETYVYDAVNQVTHLVNAKGNGTVLSSFQYTYDGAGNQRTKTEGNKVTYYDYDTLNRLSTVTEYGEKVTIYTYDGAGNRKTEAIQKGIVSNITVYHYDKLNRLTSTVAANGATARYLYDDNGNLITKSTGTLEDIRSEVSDRKGLPEFGLIIQRETDHGTGTKDLTYYTYDNRNQLTEMKKEKTSTAYRYNAQGYRVEKKVGSDTTRYLYEYDKVVLETDGTNREKAFQAHGSNLLYRSVTGNSGVEETYYYLYNAHGDVTELVDSEGKVAVSYEYDAFGNIIKQSGTADNPVKYAGYQHDQESGLYYLNARYYDSVTARFITEDTYLGQKNDPLSLNLYTYCANNPIMYIDPSGHLYYIGNNCFSSLTPTTNTSKISSTKTTNKVGNNTSAQAAAAAGSKSTTNTTSSKSSGGNNNAIKTTGAANSKSTTNITPSKSSGGNNNAIKTTAATGSNSTTNITPSNTSAQVAAAAGSKFITVTTSSNNAVGNNATTQVTIESSNSTITQGTGSGDNNYFNYNWKGDNVTSEFKDKVLTISDNLQINPDDLMAIMAFESGFNPLAKNKYSGATGLIQFMPSTAKNLGTSTDGLSKMSAVEQLDYVYEYLNPYTGKLNSVEDAYMAVFMPIAVSKENDYVLGKVNSSDCISGKLTYGKVYEQNKGLDYNNDGVITKEEAAKKVKDKREEYK